MVCWHELMPADHVQAPETMLLLVLLLGSGSNHPSPTAGWTAISH